MKKIIFAAGLLLTAASAFAGETETALKVTLANGTSESYLLSEKPVISYSGNDMVIKTSQMTGTYARADVASMSFFQKETNGIEAVTEGVTYVFLNDTFTCEGQSIRVYNLSGMCVASGTDTVSLQTLPAGIYLINVNNKTIKIIKR